MDAKTKKYIGWLERKSILWASAELAKLVSGKATQWQHPYAVPQAQELLATNSVWFSVYPPATITKVKQNILQFLADEDLLQMFTKLGIKVIHTGPMKEAGGIKNKKKTPSIDGWFDRISLDVDAAFGSEQDYHAMTKKAAKHGIIIAGDIIPGHTGKGADFLLALRNYKDYPGIYVLVEIAKEDWHLLPKVTNIWKSVNLNQETVDILQEKNYIPGRLQRVLFTVPGAERQVTGWDATGEIEGVDGKIRRFVYLHYFKAGQPTMNWLDPSFAAQKIIAGDVIKSITVLKNKIVRLDANPFLGIEKKSDSKTAWSEGHPLSLTSSNNIASLIRKLNGWSFQELNLTFAAIKKFSELGPELSYDFITRPAVQHAMLTGDTTFLRFCYQLMRKYQINPRILIHDMQNHDEITYELVHFLEHSEEKFKYDGKIIAGKQLRDKIVNEMHDLAISDQVPYNKLSGNGLCTTFIGLIATRLKIKDIYNLNESQKAELKKGHLLLAMFNAMQPGVFGLSGWDLVGALPLPLENIQEFIRDGDYRWINRGAYDLLNANSKAQYSCDNVPKATTLYASLSNQLQDRDSFLSQLINMLKLREKYKIAVAEQIAIPEVNNKGVIILVHKLPEKLGLQITALNFSDRNVEEKLNLHSLNIFGDFAQQKLYNMVTNEKEAILKSGEFSINLTKMAGKLLLLQP